MTDFLYHCFRHKLDRKRLKSSNFQNFKVFISLPILIQSFAKVSSMKVRFRQVSLYIHVIIYYYHCRYLYVNCRPWPKDYDIQNPLSPPPIAQQIDIHVIDLLRLTEVGTMYRAHKAYTPNDECFFIFLDVSQQYVAR